MTVSVAKHILTWFNAAVEAANNTKTPVCHCESGNRDAYRSVGTAERDNQTQQGGETHKRNPHPH